MDRRTRAVSLALAMLLALPWAAGCQRSKPRRAGASSALATLAMAIPSATPTLPPMLSATEGAPPTDTLAPAPPETATPPLTPSATVTWAPTATASPTAISPTPLPTGDITYTVREGDTLSSLARAYRTTVWAIMNKNGLTDPDHLRVGQTLIIPVGSMPSQRIHRVQPGESLASIARRYGVSLAALAQANGLSNPNRIAVGQVLVIPQ